MRKHDSLAVHTQLLRYQRSRWLCELRNETEKKTARVHINHADEGVLLSLFTGQSRNVKQLAEQLSIEKSWMSRIVQSLIERHLLSSEPDAQDKRSNVLRLTSRGESGLMTAAEKASAVLQETSATLNERSRKRFSSLLQKFIDGFAFSADTHHEVLDRLYLQLWQLNRAVGLTGENFLGSRLSISQVHVLTLLVEKQESMICARDIDDLLPFDASTISRIVARFEKNGWIKRSPLPGDKRSLALALTTAGLASVHQLHQAVRSAFDQALREFSPSDESEFIQLLDRLATSAESIVQSKRQQFLKPISDQVLNERRSAEPLTEILRRSAVSGAEFFAFEYARDCPAYCVVSEERGRKFALFAVPLDTSTGSESLTKAYRELVKADLRKRQ